LLTAESNAELSSAPEGSAGLRTKGGLALCLLSRLEAEGLRLRWSSLAFLGEERLLGLLDRLRGDERLGLRVLSLLAGLLEPLLGDDLRGLRDLLLSLFLGGDGV